MSRSRGLAIVTVAAAGIAVGLAGGGCDRQNATGAATTQPAGAAPARMAPPVSVVEATTQDVPVYIDEIGTCAAREFVQVRPQVAGKVVEIHFQDGQDLKKGDKLFTIDARPYQATLEQAKASLVQAQANLVWAKQQLENAQGAAAARAISKEELQNRQNAVTVADAEIKVRQAAIVAAEIDVEYCTITSPIDGRAGQRLVDVGNVVKANEGALLTIQRMEPIYADFTTSEKNLDEVRSQAAKGVLKTLVWSPQQGEAKARQGELTFLDNSVQQGAGTIKLRATLGNQDRQFWPGQFVNVRLVLDTKKDAVMVPARAMQIGQQGPFVYVVKDGTDPEGKPQAVAELRPIVHGQRHGDMVVVEKGLAPGERVVIIGHMMIMPGGPVMVMPAQPLQGAAAQPATAPASH